MSDAADEPITTLDPIEPAPKRRSPVPIVLGVVAVLALIVGVFVIARDGDGGGSDDPLALLSAAPDAARDAGSARMKMTMSMGGEGFSMDVEGEGLVDFESGAGSFDMSMMGIDVSVISDGETVWMKIPTGPVDGKSWVAMPADAMEGQQQLGSIDSTAGLLDALRGVGAEIEELGSEEVNGVETTHYSTVVDLQAAIAAAPEADRGDARAALEQFSSLGLEDVGFPIDVWVTDDGLPARMVMTFSPPSGETASLLGDFDLKLQLDMTDFGTPVEIDPPDPTDVREISDPSEIDGLFGGGMKVGAEDWSEYREPPAATGELDLDD